MLKLTVDSKQVEHLFKDLGAKLPKVMADTCNMLATKIQASTINEMKSKFKGGTSGWVLNSFGVTMATPSNPVAVVKYNRGRHFMAIQVDGGARPAKAAETLLRNKGVMGADQSYLPGPGAPRDQYGNLSPGTRSQILSYFQTYTGKKTRNNRQGASLRSGVSFFALKQGKGKLSAGVYQRTDDPKTSALRAQRAMIAKKLIAIEGKGFGFAKGSKAGKELRQRLGQQLKAINKAMLPRGKNLVMAFDKVKPYTPLIKFYENGNKIVADNTVKVFRSVANIEMGGRLGW